MAMTNNDNALRFLSISTLLTLLSGFQMTCGMEAGCSAGIESRPDDVTRDGLIVETYVVCFVETLWELICIFINKWLDRLILINLLLITD